MGPKDYCEECGHHVNLHEREGCTVIIMVLDGEHETETEVPCGCMAWEFEEE